MREKKSRFEVNKEVRRVLTRNGADTVEIGFQVYGREINLYGKLIHGDNSDFSAVEIENLLTDFQGSLPGYNITGETTTWTFDHQSITRVGKRDVEKEAEELVEEEEKIILKDE